MSKDIHKLFKLLDQEVTPENDQQLLKKMQELQGKNEIGFSPDFKDDLKKN